MGAHRRSLLVVLLAVSALGLGACGSTATVPADLVRLADLVDEARSEARACGSTWFEATTPLATDPQLQTAAQVHSEDMHTNGFMNHFGSDGSNVGERVTRQGYTWSSVGENIAAGFGTPEAVMAAWLSSPGHCANVMRSSYAHLGVGRSGSFWTQVFARP